jgi:hypothetical protein
VPEIRTGIRREDASQELQDAIDRAHEGDRAALPIIREHLVSRPDEYWRMVDYARVVQNGQIKTYMGAGLYVQEVMNQRVERLRKALEGDNPSPLESLLVERIISCYLHVNFAENEYTDAIGGGTRIEVAEYMQKRLDRAHRRYLAAVKALAQIRKMGPAIQINIARKQLNMAGALVGHPVGEPMGESTEGEGVAS